MKVCPTNPNLFAHGNKCISQCPDTYFSDNSTRTCTQTCNTSVGYIAYNLTRMCVLVCIGNTYARSGVCVSQCYNASETPPLYYIDNTTKSCVTVCPDYYFKDDTTGQCVLADACSDNYYADFSVRACVLLCNASLYIYKDDSTMQCVE